MTTPFTSITSCITFPRPITSGSAVGNVTIIPTGEWRFEFNVHAACLWKRWKLRGARVTFAVIFTPLTGTKVRRFTTASWSVTSKPLLIALCTHLSPYTSARHNVLYIRSSFDLVSSGCFKCCNRKEKKNSENPNTERSVETEACVTTKELAQWLPTLYFNRISLLISAERRNKLTILYDC
jgi:hypothetical protein